jgi:hypothetical protein
MNESDLILIREALRFLVWAAGEGISPVDEKLGDGPEEILYQYAVDTGEEDYDTIPGKIMMKLRKMK